MHIACFILREETDPLRLKVLKRQQQLAKKDRNEKNSLRMDAIYRLSLARYVGLQHFGNLVNYILIFKMGILF